MTINHRELSERAWHIFAGVLSAFADIVVIALPISSIVVLAIVVGAWLVVIGTHKLCGRLRRARQPPKSSGLGDMENHKSSSIRRMPTMTCTAVAVRSPVDRTPRGGGRPVFPWPNPRRPAQRASPARRKTMSTRLFRRDDRPVTRPAQREDEATDIAVSGLREAAGSDPDDPRVRSLIDELSAASERFRELFARADVGYRVGVLHMRHPVVGNLYLYRNRFNIPHSGGSAHADVSRRTGQRLGQSARLAAVARLRPKYFLRT